MKVRRKSLAERGNNSHNCVHSEFSVSAVSAQISHISWLPSQQSFHHTDCRHQLNLGLDSRPRTIASHLQLLCTLYPLELVVFLLFAIPIPIQRPEPLLVYPTPQTLTTARHLIPQPKVVLCVPATARA